MKFRLKDVFRSKVVDAEPEPSAVPETTEQGETPAVQIQIPESARRTVFKFLSRHGGSNKRETRAGVKLDNKLVDAILTEGVLNGTLTLVPGIRGAQQYWVGVPPTFEGSSSNSEPLKDVEIATQSPDPEIGTDSPCCDTVSLVPNDFLLGMTQAGCNAASPAVESSVLPAPSTPEPTPAEGVSVPVAEPKTVDPKMRMIITFLQANGEVTARETAGGTGLEIDNVRRLLADAVASGEVVSQGIDNYAKFRLASFQPKQPETQPAPVWIHPDAIWSANERKRVLAEEKLRNPEPPVKKPVEPQLSDIKEPTVVWTEAMERDYQLRHKDRIDLKY